MDTAENTAIHAASDLDLRVPFYCEENAWRVLYRHLVAVTTTSGTNACVNNEYHIVFISNEARCCPFYHQRAKPLHQEDEYVCWDYHVIVIRTTETASSSGTITTEVLDVDSWMPYPCPINYYLDETFRLNALKSTTVGTEFHPLFRVIPAHQYLKYFFSDRMHMFQHGKWMARPPEYKPIMNGLMHANEKEVECKRKKGNVSNLEKYIDMVSCSSSSNDGGRNDDERMGTVFTLDDFRARFTDLADNKDDA